MTTPTFTLVAKDYGHLAPLALGDVRADGFTFMVDRDTRGAVGRTLKDPDVMLGESSISRQVARIAEGDTTWVAVPFFLMRNFRHRCFFVRSDDERASFQDLVGGRIGTDNWMASGNTWSRAAIREQGIGIDRFSWVCGPVEGIAEGRPQGNLPPNAVMAPSGRLLPDMLLDGELDAIMVPDPPRDFLEPTSPFRRLFVDFRSVEEAYYDRTGLWPGLHLAVVRRTVVEEHPGVLRALSTVLEDSRARWWESRQALNETPWMLEEVESSLGRMRAAGVRNGFDAIASTVDYFCGESNAQGLTDRRVGAEEVFADFLATG